MAESSLLLVIVLMVTGYFLSLKSKQPLFVIFIWGTLSTSELANNYGLLKLDILLTYIAVGLMCCMYAVRYKYYKNQFAKGYRHGK